jgi:hypothetical protein
MLQYKLIWNFAAPINHYPITFFDPTAVNHKPHLNSIFRSDSITVAYQQAWKKTKSDTKRRERKPTTVIGHIAFSKNYWSTFWLGQNTPSGEGCPTERK